MSAPGNVGRQATAARGARVVHYLGEPANPEREAKPLVIPPGVCPRCGEEKSWLRPGETCAGCLIPRGVSTARAVDEDEEPVPGWPPVVTREVEMAATAIEERTCPVCGTEFEPQHPRQVNCSRACTVKAADRRRGGRPIEDKRTASMPSSAITPTEKDDGQPRRDTIVPTARPKVRRGGRKPGTWALAPKALWDWRVAAKVSRATLAKTLGVSATSVQNWETGHAVPSPKYQAAISDLMARGAPAPARRTGLAIGLPLDLEAAGRELGAAIGRFLAALRAS